MTQGREQGKRGGQRAASVGALLLALALGGCSVPFADMPWIGLPANTPPRPADPGEYPAVHDLPVPRTDTVLDAAAQQRIENELIAARDRQAGAGHGAARRSTD